MPSRASCFTNLPAGHRGFQVEKFAEKYRPRGLHEIVGQPAVRFLMGLVADPFPTCVLLESSVGGTGKTTAALALAAELGCLDEMSGLIVQPCSELSVDRARELFTATLRYRPFEGRGWRVLVLEELDWVSPQVQRFLKVALETNLPKKCIVVATSNDSSKLDRPLLQRFTNYSFVAGASFAEDCRERIAEIWNLELPGEPLPPGWESWGEVEGGAFSMRKALDGMQNMVGYVRSVNAAGKPGANRLRAVG